LIQEWPRKIPYLSPLIIFFFSFLFFFFSLPSLAAWGAVAVVGGGFYAERVPLLRQDIFSKVPLLNLKYGDTYSPKAE